MELFVSVLVAQLDVERVEFIRLELVAPVLFHFRLPVSIQPAVQQHTIRVKPVRLDCVIGDKKIRIITAMIIYRVKTN